MKKYTGMKYVIHLNLFKTTIMDNKIIACELKSYIQRCLCRLPYTRIQAHGLLQRHYFRTMLHRSLWKDGAIHRKTVFIPWLAFSSWHHKPLCKFLARPTNLSLRAQALSHDLEPLPCCLITRKRIKTSVLNYIKAIQWRIY